MERIVVFLVIVALFWGPASATVIHVPEQYSTIQAGINASVNNDTVLVQPGVYHELINFNGHNIVLGSQYLIDNDTTNIPATIIDGDSSGTVISFLNAEDSTSLLVGFTIQNGKTVDGGGIRCVGASPIIRHNLIVNNVAYGLDEDCRGGGIYLEHSSAAINNNKIFQNCSYGYADSPWYEAAGYGGGLYCLACTSVCVKNNIFNLNGASVGAGICCISSHLSINDNIITNSSDLIETSQGGGIYCDYCDIEIQGDTISGNSSDGGGGICCFDSNPVIRNDVIVENYVRYTGGGGGIMILGGALIENCLIRRNRCFQGGGIFGYMANANVRYNLIVENIATGNGWDAAGAGIKFEHSTVNVTNNTITGNISDDAGSGFDCEDTHAIVTNSILWNNSPSEIVNYGGSTISIRYSDIQGGWSGQGNLNAYPGFCMTDSIDYSLAENSPCHRSGCDSLGMPDTLIDVGAFGVGCTQVGISSIRGFITDNSGNPIEGVNVTIPQVGIDISDTLGIIEFIDIIAGEYAISFEHQDYIDTTLIGVFAAPGDTTIINMIMRSRCNYLPGDINGNGSANGVDVVYAVNYFKGTGNAPPMDCGGICPEPSPFYAAGDVNGNCAFNGIDITFFVRYLKGQVPSLMYCSDCPPAGMNPPAPAVEPIRAPTLKAPIKDKASGLQ